MWDFRSLQGFSWTTSSPESCKDHELVYLVSGLVSCLVQVWFQQYPNLTGVCVQVSGSGDPDRGIRGRGLPLHPLPHQTDPESEEEGPPV